LCCGEPSVEGRAKTKGLEKKCRGHLGKLGFPREKVGGAREEGGTRRSSTKQPVKESLSETSSRLTKGGEKTRRPGRKSQLLTCASARDRQVRGRGIWDKKGFPRALANAREREGRQWN